MGGYNDSFPIKQANELNRRVDPGPVFEWSEHMADNEADKSTRGSVSDVRCDVQGDLFPFGSNRLH